MGRKRKDREEKWLCWKKELRNWRGKGKKKLIKKEKR